MFSGPFMLDPLEGAPLTGQEAMAPDPFLVQAGWASVRWISGNGGSNAHSPLDHMVDKLLSNDVKQSLSFCRTF